MPRTRQLSDVLRKINKNITPKIKTRSLTQVEGNLCFWVQNGPVLKNITDLNSALKTMGEDQFNHHVNQQRNDFAAWVGEALKDRDLAEKIKQVHTRDSAVSVISSHLKTVYGIDG